MAYEFVCESEAKCYRSNCSDVLKKTCELLKEEGISAQFSLVGSGARNMITRNGEGPYGLGSIHMERSAEISSSKR